MNSSFDLFLKVKSELILDFLLCWLKLKQELALSNFVLRVRLVNDDIGVEQEDFVDAVGVWMEKGVSKAIETLVASFERIPL